VIYDIHTGDDLYGRLAMLQPGDEVSFMPAPIRRQASTR
jgi:hypothetical protein